MPSRLILPSTDEVERAAAEIAQGPPVPLARIVDSSPGLRSAVENMAGLIASAATARELYEVMKVGVVFGLHLGIVIGEARAGRAKDQLQ